MTEYEQLGVFYLGKSYDLASRQRGEELVMYDSKDLVTHAVCVGMTGSGKTGLCVGILEEAAIDGIPSIVIDPKGDLVNLLLMFPSLRGEDFLPWVNEDDARRQGLTASEFADRQAELWGRGLEQWGQSGERIGRLREAAEFVVYTPGSSAGIPVSILKSLAAPPVELMDDREWMRDRVNTTATSLLALLGIEADPIKSREHILLTTLIHRSWSQGDDLDLAALIQQIQSPPASLSRIGVLELESFFPAQDRFALAMQFNNLLASPGFSAWMEGEPLDIGSILHTPAGKPRVAVFSIAHLGEAERMFFVSLLMNQILGWTRMQSGTTSLRAVVYMDEIAGYFPPVANPPSKQPMLTLMKQARAFGVGMVLATQNPVDLDYKGLSNAGTWFIGRLQTERDKARVLDGLEGAAAAASAAFDRASVEQTLSQLGSRVFLMNNVHEDGPVIFETRWCLSYLRGPMTRQQIRRLTELKRAEVAGASAGAAVEAPASGQRAETRRRGDAGSVRELEPGVLTPEAAPTPRVEIATSGAVGGGLGRPVLPPDVPQYFLPRRGIVPAGTTLLYKPMLLGTAKVYFADAKAGVDTNVLTAHVAGIEAGVVAVDWDHSEAVRIGEADLAKEPDASGMDTRFDELPPDAGKARSFEAWKKSYAEMLLRTQKIELLRSELLGEVSKVGEGERDFRLRLQQAARERRDALAGRLRQKYASRMATLNERIRRAEQAVDVQKGQARDAKLSSALSFGTAVLSAFLGRKTIRAGSVSKAASAVRGASRSAREAGDVHRAEETVEALRQQLSELQAQFDAEVEAGGAKVDPMMEELEEITVKPKKTNITVRAVVLAWAPYVERGGVVERAW
ncbi:MAG: ATP-binding protein [Phycisphaerales bacterium]